MEILYTYTELKGTAFLVGAPGIFGTMICLVYMMMFALPGKKYDRAIIAAVVAFFCILSFKYFYMPIVDSGKANHVYYEVLIKDKSKVDALEYKFVEKRGKITVLEKIHPTKKEATQYK